MNKSKNADAIRWLIFELRKEPDQLSIDLKFAISLLQNLRIKLNREDKDLDAKILTEILRQRSLLRKHLTERPSRLARASELEQLLIGDHPLHDET